MTKELFEAIIVQLEPDLAKRFLFEAENDNEAHMMLEIINKKDVDVVLLKVSKCLEDYNQVMNLYDLFAYKILTQEEFDLLKEVLKDDRL